MTDAYITGVGAYLPGEPVDNEELAARFGDGTRWDAAMRGRVLTANGIRTRHYALGEKLTTRRRVMCWFPGSRRWCTDASAVARWRCFQRAVCAQRGWPR